LGFAQALGWQPLPLVTDARSPLYATLGRANFLAAYLVILLPLTAALGLQRHRHWQHTILAILLLAELTVIGLTMARTAWLAAAVSLGLFALLWRGGSWRWQYGVGLGLTAVSGPLLILTNINQQGSLAARRTIWQATMKLIGERPFLGYGLDSLELIFPGVYPPELVYYQGRDVFVDRAHNLLLDWAVTTGIIGVVVHLLFWGVIFWLMGRAWQQTADRQRCLLLTAILAALIGNLTNTLTSFDVTTTSVAVWLLLGVGMALSQPALPSVHLPTPSGIRWGLAGLVIVGGLSAVWWGNGRPFLADQAAYQAKHQAQAGDLDSAISTAERAIRLAPYEPNNYYEALARLYWQKISDDPTAWAQAEAALLAARDLRPLADGRWLTLAEFYAVSAVELNRETATFATQAYAQAAQLSPHDSQIYTAWGQFEWVRREWETAVSLWQQAADLDATNAPAHAYLAQGYWRLGEPEQAADALAQALKYDPHNKLALALQQQISARP
jgi:Flp pilus assembly protein TadD